jgi:hypothetical protein
VGLKARRGDLSGPVLAILVTLVLLAIGAAIIAYFVLIGGGAPQQAVIAVVGQPTIVKDGSGFIANITIKNVGSASATLSKDDIKLNIIEQQLIADYLSSTSLSPGSTAAIGFKANSGWSTIQNKETVSGALVIRGVGTLEVVFRVIKPS